MGSKTGECEDPGFSLPVHIEKGFSIEESAGKIADYFSQISQEFIPLDIEALPTRVKQKIDSHDERYRQDENMRMKMIEEYEVHEKIKHAKKTKSSVPGDIPQKIMKEFSPELSKPIAAIMNKITASGIYPQQWKEEYVTPIPKINPPESEEDLRNISLTAFLSKIYESFLVTWLLPVLLLYMDPGQLGGMKDCSTTHYLIKLFAFIQKTGDMPSNLSLIHI